MARPPLVLRDAPRVVGLRSLWSSARRVVVVRQGVVRRTLRHAGATLPGLSPGQPRRQTAQPTTAMRLAALRGVTLSRRKIAGKLHEPLTPLHAGQKRLLARMEVPRESYDKRVT